MGHWDELKTVGFVRGRLCNYESLSDDSKDGKNRDRRRINIDTA